MSLTGEVELVFTPSLLAGTDRDSQCLENSSKVNILAMLNFIRSYSKDINHVTLILISLL